MQIGSVNFPEALLNAQKAGNLVIFAGAGVSMGPPANYPSFLNLADQVAVRNGQPVREGEEPIERFLGRLHHQGINIHLQTQRLLSNPSSQPNQLHYDLLRLFQSPTDVRLVTTNFDNHFSSAALHVFGEESHKIETFYAPALPLGDKFQGIIYHHGHVDKSAEQLVITDSDFGRAYLIEGWATRFLQAMFSKYTVLFVGYSHNDVVLNYLARGLSPDLNGARFALINSDDDPKRWQYINVEPIIYPLQDGSHRSLGESISKWVERSKWGALDHERRIQEIVEVLPPLDLETIDYLDSVLGDIVTARFFTRYAKTVEWLHWLENREKLKPLFQLESTISEIDGTFANWFAEQFVCHHCDEALALVHRCGQIMNYRLWYTIAGCISGSQQQSLEPSVLSRWIVVLLAHAPRSIDRSKNLDYILKDCRYPEDESTAILLFQHLTCPRRDLSRVSHIALAGDTYWLNETWNSLFRPNLPAFAEKLMPVLISHLQQAHLLLKASGSAHEDWDHMSYGRSAIEPHKQDEFVDEIDILIDATRDVFEWMLQHKPGYLYIAAEIWSNSDVPLIKRFALHGVMTTNQMSADNKIIWLLNKDWLHKGVLKHEVFRLLQLCYPLASEATQSLVLQQIKHSDDLSTTDEDVEYRPYQTYNLLFWLHCADPSCQLAAQEFRAMQRSYPNFQPREYPDLTHWGSVRVEGDVSEMQIDELLKQNPELLVHSLFSGWEEAQNHQEFLAVLSEAISKSSTWAIQLATALQRVENQNSGLWQAVWNQILIGLQHTALQDDQWVEVLNLMQAHSSISSSAENMIDLLEQGIYRSQGAIPQSCLRSAQQVAERLWTCINADTTSEPVNSDNNWLSRSINRPGGGLARFWLHALSRRQPEFSTENKIPPNFRKYFNEVVDGSSSAAEMGRVVLASQLQFLFSLDPQWTRSKLLPLFNWLEDMKQAQQSWHGFLTWGRWSEEMLPDLMPLYRQAFQHIPANLENSQLRSQFCLHLASIAIYGSINPMEEGWLREFLVSVESRDRQQFAFHIGSRLRSIQPDAQQNLWERWMNHYWEQRNQSVPIGLDQAEWEEMIKWVLDLNAVFPSVVERICSGSSFSLVDQFFYYTLQDKDYAERYPDALAELLLYLLKATNISFQSCRQIETTVRSLIQYPSLKSKLRRICDELSRLGCHNAISLSDMLDS